MIDTPSLDALRRYKKHRNELNAREDPKLDGHSRSMDQPLLRHQLLREGVLHAEWGLSRTLRHTADERQLATLGS